MCVCVRVCIYIYIHTYISLGTLVPNSRDRQGKLWLLKKQKTALKTTLARPVFSQGKSKIPFFQKVSMKQSASVIL